MSPRVDSTVVPVLPVVLSLLGLALGLIDVASDLNLRAPDLEREERELWHRYLSWGAIAAEFDRRVHALAEARATRLSDSEATV